MTSGKVKDTYESLKLQDRNPPTIVGIWQNPLLRSARRAENLNQIEREGQVIE